MHKTHIFDQKNNEFFFLATYLPYLFLDPYRKQTISFFRPYAAGGYFGQYKIMQKKLDWNPGMHMGPHLRVPRENFPMNTNMTGFRWFSKILMRPHAMDKSSLSINWKG